MLDFPDPQGHIGRCLMALGRSERGPPVAAQRGDARGGPRWRPRLHWMCMTRTPLRDLRRRHWHDRRCTTYLMGNHIVAERMYRHDSGVMLYAPLRVTI